MLGSPWAKERDTLPARPIASVAGLVTLQPPALRWEHCYAASPFCTPTGHCRSSRIHALLGWDWPDDGAGSKAPQLVIAACCSL